MVIKAEIPEGYKQTDVGVMPEDWEVKLLPDVCRFRGGKAHEQHVSEFGQYVCVNSKFISSDGQVRKYCTANFCSARKDDVLMVMSDLPNGKALAKAYFVEKDDLYAVNQRVCALTAYRDDPQYLFYFLNRNAYFLKFDDGVNQTHLLNNVFAKCPVALPPTKAEQTAIATALSDADKLIASLNKLIAKKRNIKQGTMQQLLTGKKRLPGFSGEWETKKLGEVGKCIRGVSYNGERDLSLHDTDTTVRLLRANNVQNGTIDLNELQYVNDERVKLIQYLQEKDIVICMANGSKQLVGKSAIFNVSDNHKYTFGAFMGCFRTDPNQAVKNFISFSLQTYQYRFFIAILLSGSSINNLKPSDIESIEIPYPKTEEQTAIAKVLSDMDVEIESLEKKRDKYKDIKQGVMQELLTGRIRLV